MKRLFIIFVILCYSNAFAYISENIVSGCSATRAKNFYPVFQILSYTCEPGYFLPADTLVCQPCPIGHTCNGGTFNYNPTRSQGIKFTYPTNTNVAKSCSMNFGTKLIPVFEINTVNLTWNDGNGNTTSTTCTYGETISLPETEPTRTGYVFNGWVVRQE